jgi:hypothetical protein
MVDKLCDKINEFVKDEAKAVLIYMRTLGDIEIRPEVSNKIITVDSKSISIYNAVEKVIKEQADHFFIWKVIGEALSCPEPVMSKDEVVKLGEALETIGERLEEKGEMLEEKGERLEKKGEELERKVE